MLCPLCRTKTSPLDEQGIMAAQCPQCRGIWVGKLALDRLTRREVSSPVLTAGGPPLQEIAAQVTQSDSKSQLDCPYCAVPMNKERFHPQIPVQIDHCPRCDYIWLDAGEQDLLLRLYRELMSGDDAAVAERRDKLAKLDALRTSTDADLSASFDNDATRAAGIASSALNTGLNIMGDLSRRDGGVSVVIDVAEFVIGLFVH